MKNFSLFDMHTHTYRADALAFFRDSLISGDFPVAEKADNGPDPCRYCKYGKICGRIEKEGADE